VSFSAFSLQNGLNVSLLRENYSVSLLPVAASTTPEMLSNAWRMLDVRDTARGAYNKIYRHSKISGEILCFFTTKETCTYLHWQ
jgi:hypothetical protein